MKYTELTFTELVNKIGSSRFFDLPSMLKEAFTRLANTPSGDPRPYKVYTALLSQSGTDAPVAIVLENTLGDIQFGYSSPGQYIISSEGLFLEDLTYCFINNSNDGDFVGSPHLISKTILDTSTIGFTVTVLNTGTPENSFLYKTEIEIRVYN